MHRIDQVTSLTALERVLSAAIAVLLSAQVLVVAEHRSRPVATPVVAATPPPQLGQPVPAVTPAAPARSPSTETVLEPPAVRSPAPAMAVAEPVRNQETPDTPEDRARSTRPAGTAEPMAVAARAPRRDPDRERFERSHPAHAAASQSPGDPATTRWAVIIGINDHSGATRDNVASRQDAEDLERLLLTHGWRPDHVLVLTDGDATREAIEQALSWLARKTNDRSVSLVHYSGHVKQWHRDVDGDGEVVDEGLWPADNRFITDRRFADLLHGVAGRLWIDIAACQAAGMADPGLIRPGRVLTLSSREDEKSYEDPSLGNSVWGYFMLEEALQTRYADEDGDGDVTVQEAFAFAAPRATKRTSKQAYGAQHPVMIDRTRRAFSLALPRPTDHGEDEDDDSRCTLMVCVGDDGRRR